MRRFACVLSALLAWGCGGVDPQQTNSTTSPSLTTSGSSSDDAATTGAVTDPDQMTGTASATSGDSTMTTTAQESTTADASSGSSASTTPGFCECIDAQASNAPKTCVLEAANQRCRVASDCCPASIPEGYSCLDDYPFLYECVAGQCRSASCESDQQCAAQAAAVNATAFECTPGTWPCADYSYCTYALPPTTCSTAADCCAASPPFECGEDYPYLIDCIAGECTSSTCTNDAECATYASEYGLMNLGCSTAEASECWGAEDAPEWNPTPLCTYALPCTIASDCCPDPIPDGYSCLDDYPYLYECNGGKCSTAPCVTDNDCSAYASALGTTATCAAPGA